MPNHRRPVVGIIGVLLGCVCLGLCLGCGEESPPSVAEPVVITPPMEKMKQEMMRINGKRFKYKAPAEAPAPNATKGGL